MKMWIDSGPLTATRKLSEVPQTEWRQLMLKRQSFVKVHLTHDCRCLVQFVDDADRMFGPLGFKSANEFIKLGLKLKPREIRLAVGWLKINKPTEEISLPAVLRAKAGRPRKGEENPSRRIKYGENRAYILAKLKRDGHAGLATKVEDGWISAKAAARIAWPEEITCPQCGHKFTR